MRLRNPTLGAIGVLVAALAFTLAACGGAGGAASTAGETPLESPVISPTPARSVLDGTEWLLTSLEGRKPVKGTPITLHFGGGWIGGYTGCNNYYGEYRADRGVLMLYHDPESMGQVMVYTDIYCEHAAAQEGRYQGALQGAVGYRVTGNRLELKDDQGRTILVFKRHRES